MPVMQNPNFSQFSTLLNVVSLPLLQALMPAELRRRKAVAVVGMLERRIGEGAFQQLLSQMVQDAGRELYHSAGDKWHRLLSTESFIRMVGAANFEALELIK